MQISRYPSKKSKKEKKQKKSETVMYVNFFLLSLWYGMVWSSSHTHTPDHIKEGKEKIKFNSFYHSRTFKWFLASLSLIVGLSHTFTRSLRLYYYVAYPLLIRRHNLLFWVLTVTVLNYLCLGLLVFPHKYGSNIVYQYKGGRLCYRHQHTTPILHLDQYSVLSHWYISVYTDWYKTYRNTPSEREKFLF